jgi:PKD repeat protein
MVSTIVPTASRSQPIQYGHTWGTNDNDVVNAIEVDSVGNVYIAGYSVDTIGGMAYSFIAKLSPDGAIIWDRDLVLPNGHILIYDISFSQSGDLYVLGEVDTAVGSLYTVSFYAKMTKDGSLLYAKALGGIFQPVRIVTDPYSSGFLVTSAWSDQSDGTVVSISDGGAVRWSIGAIDAPAAPYGIVVDSAGYSYEFSDRSFANDVGIEKFNATGHLIKQRLLNTPNGYEYTWDLALGHDGSLYALGAAFNEGLLLLIKFTPNLDVVWSEFVGSPMMYHEATKLVLAADGTLVAVGSAYDFTNSSRGPALYSFDTSGNLLGASLYGISNSASTLVFNDAASCPGHGVMIAGGSMGPPQIQELPIANVTFSAVPDMWENDTVTWGSLSISAQDLTLTVSDPQAVVDDFSISANEQGWYGFVDTKAPQILVDITYRQHGANGERVALKATASNSTGKCSYNWNLGDGTSGTGERITHDYTTGGIFQVSVRVTDSAGEYGVARVDVRVMGPPVITGLNYWPMPPMVNLPLTFAVQASDPDGGSLAGYYWNFGDSTTSATQNGTVTHTYAAVGTYNLTITVVDNEGASSSASWAIAVLENNNTPPYAYFTVYPANPQVGEWVLFDGSSSYDPDGWIAAYQWDLGDGTFSNGTSVLYAYPASGVYTARLTVYDNLGALSSYQRQVTVQGPAPVLPDIYEPDNSYTNASTIALGGSQAHTINAGGADVDWVRFTMNQTGDVVIGTSGPAGDTVIYLYNMSGVPTTPMAVDDDSGPGNWSQIIRTLGPGTYYVKVMEDGQNQEIASYTLQARLVGVGVKWTFMVYLDGDNNLEEVALTDFLEMSSVGSNADINIIVQMDRTPGFSASYGDWTDTKRFYVTPGMTPTPENAVADMGELDMGLSGTLSDFVTWGMTDYPADNYMLVLWDHGGGWDGAVCWDDTNGGDALTLSELDNALNISSMATGEKLDAVGFDACLMGMAEVAYEIRNREDVLVFSEETVPWDGWPYNTVLSDLAADPNMGAAAFGTRIVNRYMEFYLNYSSNDTDVTMSALNLAATGPLYQAVESLANALTANLGSYRNAITMARNATQSFADYNYMDLYDFASEVKAWVGNWSVQVAAQDVMDEITAAMISNGHGNYLPGANGLSIYFPRWGYSGAYSTLYFSTDLSWDEFLMAYTYFIPAVPDAYEPDNTYTQAKPIGMGEIQTHSITDYGADLDWVVFNLSEEQTVVIQTSGPPNEYGDTVIALYDSFGVPNYPIAYNDDSNGTWSMIRADLYPGTYYVEVWSYDNSSEIPVYYLSLSEAGPNTPPLIQGVSYYPSNPDPNQYVDFYVYAYDPDGYIDHFEWDFGDGNAAWTSYYETYHYYQAGGVYQVSVTAVDNLGASSSYNFSLYVRLPPVAIITMPEVVKVGTPVTFSGADSYDPSGGSIVGYYWWFSDSYNGSGGPSGVETTQVFAHPGAYTVELGVVSSSGAWGYNYSEFIVVNPLPPLAIVSYNLARPLIGDVVTFDGSHSVDPDGSVTTFIWQFGDGTVSTGVTATHAYAHAGVYQVKLTVIDEDKLTDDDVATINVVAQPAAAFEFSPSQPSFDHLVDFYAYGSYDEVGIVEYAWSFGDGTYALGWQASHTYSSPGTYEVKLTVKNSAGVTASVAKSVVISSTPSSSALGGSTPIQSGPFQVMPAYPLGAALGIVVLAALLLGVTLLIAVRHRHRRMVTKAEE